MSISNLSIQVYLLAKPVTQTAFWKDELLIFFSKKNSAAFALLWFSKKFRLNCLCYLKILFKNQANINAA